MHAQRVTRGTLSLTLRPADGPTGQRAAPPPEDHTKKPERCTRTDTLYFILWLNKSWPSAACTWPHGGSDKTTENRTVRIDTVHYGTVS